MEIEVYDKTEQTVNDAGQLVAETDAEALALIEQLGLTGQQERNTSALNKVDEVSEKQIHWRNHYDLITAEQQMVLIELFPEVCKVENYKNGPIPVRILKEISFIKDHFAFVYVCYAPPAELVDPVLIAVNEEIGYWNKARMLTKCNLIARWGDALKPWAELYEDAVASRCLKMENKIKGTIAAMQSQLVRLQGGEIPEHSALINDLPRTNYMPFGDID